MTYTGPQIPAEFIVPLNMNKLRGRMLKMPSPKGKKREILIIYGHHSSLERMYSMAEVMNDFGGVTMPDLPGFGGMDSFYKIGEKPDLDTMADYLASFIKLRYKNRRFTVAGISYGFLVVTRMLQKYPDMAKKVDMLISVVGFAHHEDFVFTRRRMQMYKLGTKIFSYRLPSWLFRNIALHPFVLRTFYSKTHNAKVKFDGLDPEEHEKLTNFEIRLWRENHLRTQMYTGRSMLTVDNCKKRVELPLHHIGVEADNYLNKEIVEQHMHVIFSDFILMKAPLKKHMPNVIAGKSESMKLLPVQLKKLLKQDP